MALGMDPELQIIAAEGSNDVGLERMLAAAPDIVIVDCVPIVARLREHGPELRVIVLDADGDPDVALASIRTGAFGCVSRNTTPTELADYIKRVHAGELLYETSTLLELVRRSHILTPGSRRRTAKLAERELEVLRLLAFGWSSGEAADQLGITLNTFRTHVKNILAKLEARSKLEAVLIAIREGRISLPPDSA